MNPLKKVAYSAINQCLLKPLSLLNSLHYENANTIVISGYPRGGTTWLSEVMSTIPRSHVLWEPLHLGNNPTCKEYGFDWSNFCHPENNQPRWEEYMQKLIAGRELTCSTLTRLNLKPMRLFSPQTLILKFVNGNLLMPWMAERLPIRPIILLRHPCAVVASQLKHGSWDQLTNLAPQDAIRLSPAVVKAFPFVETVYGKLSTFEEALAFSWAIKTIVPLYFQSEKILLTHYESLVDTPEIEIPRIFKHLGRAIPNSFYEQLKNPSRSTRASSNFAKRGDALSGWQQTLDPKQIHQILNIAQEMKVSIYDESLLPNGAKVSW